MNDHLQSINVGIWPQQQHVSSQQNIYRTGFAMYWLHVLIKQKLHEFLDLVICKDLESVVVSYLECNCYEAEIEDVFK